MRIASTICSTAWEAHVFIIVICVIDVFYFSSIYLSNNCLESSLVRRPDRNLSVATVRFLRLLVTTVEYSHYGPRAVYIRAALTDNAVTGGEAKKKSDSAFKRADLVTRLSVFCIENKQRFFQLFVFHGRGLTSIDSLNTAYITIQKGPIISEQMLSNSILKI